MKGNQNTNRNFKIITKPNDITIGLFGGPILFVFEILPYLHSKLIFPDWDIKSAKYGSRPNYTIIPGVFDLAYEPDSFTGKEINLLKIRSSHVSALGCNWKSLHELWNLYFKLPVRIRDEADKLGDLSNTLGIHYRGTDKNLASWDTNPVSQLEYLTIIKDFLSNNAEIVNVFIATDEYSFIQSFKDNFPLIHITNPMGINYHSRISLELSNADLALLDCLLLSRCKKVLTTSSALSAFAKVLNPDLESYRIAASKLFSDNPYFPIAFIPKLTSNNKECQNIIERLFKEDWLQDKRTKKKYKTSFTYYKRNRRDILRKRYKRLFLKFLSKLSSKSISFIKWLAPGKKYPNN